MKINHNHTGPRTAAEHELAFADHKHQKILDEKPSTLFDVVRRRCKKCLQPKGILGGTTRAGRFYCKDCR
jgi:hypothetical protein